jgi:hypothetical protein
VDEDEFLSKPHRLLKEVFRNYVAFKQVCEQSGEFAIEYLVGDTHVFVGLTDVDAARRCVLTGEGRVKLPEQHRRAVLLNVFHDMTQKDAGVVIGGVKPVVIGQLVEVACEDLTREFFPDWYEGDSRG